MSRRVVTVCAVQDPAIWEEIAALCDLELHTDAVLSPTERAVHRSFETDVVPTIPGGVLTRYARRSVQEIAQSRDALRQTLDKMRSDVRRTLESAQRHALDDGIVFGVHAWDPEHDAPAVRALVGAELLMPMPDGDTLAYAGRYRLNPDLPSPPPVPYDFSEAVMERTDDLSSPLPGPIQLLQDIATLASCLTIVPAKRTLAGTITVASEKQLCSRLAYVPSAGGIEKDHRWGRAFRALSALGVIHTDAVSRRVEIDVGLEATLSGTTVDATDRFVHRLLDRDMHVLLPAIRSSIAQAGDGAIDEMIFSEVLRDQHRDVLFPTWTRNGRDWYPVLGDHPTPKDDAGWEMLEETLISKALDRCRRIGLIQRAPGVFCGTEDGRRWAGAPPQPAPPIWVSSDLEILVPPDAITPWERYQFERFAACLQRDTVDRYALRKIDLVRWLSTHDVGEAIEILNRRAPSLPLTVVEALQLWAESASRIVLTRGVLLAGPR